MDLRAQLIEFEGWKREAYPDPLTGGAPWTIGVGHTGPEVHPGLTWTDEQIGKALDEDIAEVDGQCRWHFPWFEHLSAPRQAVIVGMAFQIGFAGLLKFKNTLASVRDERYANAAEGMRQSLWAKQTPKRARRLAHQMETGEWQ
jgi:lysozyme